MAKPEAGAGATLPVLVVRGSHADLGRAMGERQREQIARVVTRAQEGFHEQGTTEAEVREQNAPYVAAAARIYPGYLTELEAMAEGAGVPFDVLFRLNCYEAYPPGTRPRRPPVRGAGAQQRPGGAGGGQRPRGRGRHPGGRLYQRRQQGRRGRGGGAHRRLLTRSHRGHLPR